ncbi:3-ketoacyl-CoA thiolase [candidate division WOR-3 bacterium 4484_100]|uniref:3-ketoacyl-CoA thiolase n=1 Tax=candidate division WOR-3 bacterium 4484_100 TaxID=1936077 RepID=A0A1V4QF91_UNCW3|nr:MAG: 3-ketoacyl-CoA thiolase [candidate division WOR-3 bacterium 4484_100]
MAFLRKKIYACAGFNTVSLGTGRKEFHPKKPRPGIEHYIKEAGLGAIAQVKNPEALDEGVIGNFVAERFCKQGNLGGFFPMVHPTFQYKPCIRVEGACDSGGLALVTAIKTILADIADAVLVIGVEIQNSVKAVYGADYLAAAGWFSGERKQGHVYFFPDQFSQRAGACFKKFGKERVRQGMAQWYVNAIENARKNPKAQEYHNRNPELYATAMTPPNPKVFCEHINVFDCSKVSDGASALIFASEKGLEKLGVEKKDATEVVAFAQVQDNLTTPPPDLTKLSTCEVAAKKVYERAGIGPKDLSVLDVHDCFTIAGLLAIEAAGFAGYGEGADFVKDGKTKSDGIIPTNTTGGLIGYGHPTGATGVRQAVDVVAQLLGKAGDCQVKIDPNRPFGMLSSMGGNDKTVVTMIFRKPE